MRIEKRNQRIGAYQPVPADVGGVDGESERFSETQKRLLERGMFGFRRHDLRSGMRHAMSMDCGGERLRSGVAPEHGCARGESGSETRRGVLHRFRGAESEGAGGLLIAEEFFGGRDETVERPVERAGRRGIVKIKLNRHINASCRFSA